MQHLLLDLDYNCKFVLVCIVDKKTIGLRVFLTARKKEIQFIVLLNLLCNLLGKRERVCDSTPLLSNIFVNIKKISPHFFHECRLF